MLYAGFDLKIIRDFLAQKYTSAKVHQPMQLLDSYSLNYVVKYQYTFNKGNRMEPFLPMTNVQLHFVPN